MSYNGHGTHNPNDFRNRRRYRLILLLGKLFITSYLLGSSRGEMKKGE